MISISICALASPGSSTAADSAAADSSLSYSPGHGPRNRPVALLNGLPEGELRTMLESCSGAEPRRSLFSIGHRGAPLGYPEHTREGYIAAAQMGAGMIECDVTFTRDQALVCRHSQCDLHTTTNILETPLADKCSVTPDYGSAAPFEEVSCCTSDLSLEEFKSLRGKVDYGDKKASTLEQFLSLQGTSRAQLQGLTGTLMSHRESILLFKELGVKMIPELKKPQVSMSFNGSFTQQDYAQSLIDEYISEGVDPGDVFLQSFNLEDIHYWQKSAPQFAQQAAWLDGRYRDRRFDAAKPRSWEPSMQELADTGLQIIAPPLWMLLTLNKKQQIVPSAYARAAQAAGLDIITWTLERSGSLKQGGGWYYQSVRKAIDDDSDVFSGLHVLAQDVKVRGVFSDWPATTTFYANCAGLD